MTDAEMLASVKKSLGVCGNQLDDMLTQYINEIKSFLLDAGISENNITSGIVTQGVEDLWNNRTGKLSPYFIQRATQLSYKR